MPRCDAFSTDLKETHASTTSSILILAADLFEDMELLYPLYRLREEGAEVVVAGLSMDPVTGKNQQILDDESGVLVRDLRCRGRRSARW